ncbi:DUF5345 family protein [Bacillus sp. EAC]|uniref:DUF5345 family protein n=1 Tax=Bacillus sp. EAC TaxID=1978338 RepID=UPI000B4547B8|nr:DUF5345 family protein [Bacillus sp. EAC]
MNKKTNEFVSILNQIDDLIDVPEPSISSLTQKIKMHEEQKRAAFFRELILFICVACSLFIGTILVAFETPASIIIIQVIGFIVLPFIFSRDKKKLKKEWL